MMKLSDVKNLPPESPVDEVSVTLKKVYPKKDNPSAPQNAIVADPSGEIKLVVWKHSDISKMEGKTVVIHANAAGQGLFTKLNEYNGKTTQELHVNKSGQFQFVEVYHQSKGTTPPPAQAAAPASHSASRPSQIHGATAGAATNKAVDLLIAKGVKGLELHQIEEQLWKIGSSVARVAMRIESGDLSPSRAQQEEAAYKKLDNTSPANAVEADLDSVPF